MTGTSLIILMQCVVVFGDDMDDAIDDYEELYGAPEFGWPDPSVCDMFTEILRGVR
jgi:hypothetical protein